MLLASAASDIPWVAITPFILAFVVGAVLLLAGRRVMRIAFTGAGLLVGAALGWIVSQAVELPIPDWAVIIVPAVVMAVLAALAFKLTIAVVMALVLGIAAPLALVTAGDMGLYEIPEAEHADGEADAEADEGDEQAEGIPLPEGLEDLDLPPDVAEWLRDVAEKEAGDAANEFLGIEEGDEDAEPASEDETTDEAKANGALSLSPEAQEHVDRASAFVRNLFADARARWDSFPQSLRYNLLLSSAIGALLGLLFGALAPMLSASVASAGAGSAVCLLTGSLIAARLGAAESEWMPERAGTWLTLWLVVAIIGLTIQWTTRPKPVDKSR